MTSDLRPYPKYRESGLPWLGRVPAHWKLRRAKYLYREVDERSQTGEEELCSVSHKTGVTPRKENVTMFMAESTVGYKIVRPNDLAINTLWAWMAALGIARQVGVVSPAYGVYRPLPDSELVPDFADKLLRIEEYKAEYMARSTGINASRLRLYPDQFLRIPLLVPSRDEQVAITHYLDGMDQKVRRFIRNRRRLIEVLNEQKQAIINRAVTRGLDPNAPLKPSGIDWLGDVPEHWSVVSLRRVAQSLDGQRVPLNAEQRGKMQGDYPYWGANTVIDHVDQWLFDEDLVLLGEDGAPFFIRGRDVAFHVSGKVWVNNHAHVLRPKGIVPQFLAHALNCVDYAEYVGGATRDKLTAQSMKAIPIQLPPADEQAQICAVIADAVEPVVSAREKASREIDLIREYRTRLIADVVTGKVDVRGLALAEAPLDDEQIDEGIDDEETLGDDEPELVEEVEE